MTSWASVGTRRAERTKNPTPLIGSRSGRGVGSHGLATANGLDFTPARWRRMVVRRRLVLFPKTPSSRRASARPADEIASTVDAERPPKPQDSRHFSNGAAIVSGL